MTTKQIERVVHRAPFQPFRLLLSDGEEVVVNRPHKGHVSGDQIALVGLCRQPNQPAVERFRLILVNRIADAMTLE